MEQVVHTTNRCLILKRRKKRPKTDRLFNVVVVFGPPGKFSEGAHVGIVGNSTGCNCWSQVLKPLDGGTIDVACVS